MSRVLILPDLHAPFIHRKYLSFVKGVARDYKPTHVVQIGDIVDLHVISRHASHPDAMGAIEELEAAIAQLQGFYEAFPKVTITRGNHDDRVARQAADLNIPSRYLKELMHVLEAPKGWAMTDSIVIDNVLYLHGTGRGGINHAYNLAIKHGQSVVAGHIHSQFGVKYSASPNRLIFGLNVGCAVDPNSYALEYAKTIIDRPILGCATVTKGRFVQTIPMDLGSK